MKIALVIAGVALATTPVAASGNSDKKTARSFLAAIKQGSDLNALYPGAIEPREVASLRRVAGCQSLNLTKQKGGYFTTVWDCKSKGALGMRVTIVDNLPTAVSTFEVTKQPNVGTR